MRLSRVEIENFLSIEKATVDFNDDGLMLVDGWNHDNDSANGAGKSSIFTAMSWCLFGRSSRDISPTELLRKGAKRASVRVSGSIRSKRFTAVRCRPTSLDLRIDDVEVTEAEFHEALGISLDQFLTVQYFSQGLSSRFLDLNDSSRKELLLTLVKAEVFSNAKEKADAKLKVQILAKAELASNLATLDAKISTLQESKIDTLALRARLSAAKGAKAEVISKIDSLSMVEKPDVSKYREILSKLKVEHEAALTAKGVSLSLRQALKRLEQEVPPVSDDHLSCPSCKTKLNVVAGDLAVHDHSSFLQRREAWSLEYKTKRTELISEISDLETKISRESSIVDAFNRCSEKMGSLQSDYVEAQARLRELKSFSLSKDQEIELLQDQLAEYEATERRLRDLLATRPRLFSSIENVDSDIVLATSVVQVLSPTGVSAYVMDSLIDSINDRIRTTLESVWPAATYALLSYKENKSGTVVAKLSDHLTIDGDRRSIGSLSGGERRCLSLAIDFALVDVVSASVGSNLSPVILDEPFDSLDASNRSRLLEVLRTLSADRQIVVVDHSAEAKAQFDKVLTVVKRGGVSAIAAG